MRIGEVLSLTWQDVVFAAKKITLRRQIRYLSRRSYFFTTLKTDSSNRYIIIDDYLLGELKRWQIQQTDNEAQFGAGYVYTYREGDGHILRQSKCLSEPDAEKFSPICTHNGGRLVLQDTVTKILRLEGFNAHSFRHTHATITGRRIRYLRRNFADKIF